ncbi:MAG: hypothetical protein SFV22_20275 [Saprospiraceae bacterium]|nr:hypothetical protein [Saprospiraceae bacterium]
MLTNILIRPAARGGKYLGPDAANSAHQSAYVTLRDPNSMNIVREGYVNTLGKDPGPASIMAPLSRAQAYPTDPQTVGITFELEISRPTEFWVTVKGPLSFPDQARETYTQITVLPGVDIGVNVYSTNALMPSFPEGLVVEIPGLCISKVSAQWNTAQKTITAGATVTMMCGCKINNTADWPWPPTDFNIQLVTYMRSKAVHKYTLFFTADSAFAHTWPDQAAPGDTVEEAWIFASQPKLGNQGKFRIPL